MQHRKYESKQTITRRTFVIAAGKIGFLFLLAGRMFYMQFLKKDEYKTLSDKNRIKIIILSPTRGEILDSNYEIIAKNNSCFRLFLDKNIQKNFFTELNLIYEILALDEDQKYEIEKRIKHGSRKLPIIIIDYLDWTQISLIEERRPDLKSIFIDTGLERYYPFAESMSHITGYLGRSNNSSDYIDPVISKNFKTGQTGLEKYYEEYLRGDFGHKHIEINAHGKYIRELGNKNAVKGEDLYLNIDIHLQEKANNYLDKKGSSAILMNCNTGQILVCASSPSYDPNKFNKLSHKYWNDLNNNINKPLINKTIREIYPPGSVFKIITVLAALESGISLEKKVNCTGKPFIGGNKFRCHNHSGHGNINMMNALKFSCNTYIYELAKEIGANKIIEIAKSFGFGDITKIDLPMELSGFLPSPEWKKKKYNSKWTIGDTLNLSIGQGFLSATPMQLIRMIAAIGNEGKLVTPRIKANEEEEYSYVNIDTKNLKIIKNLLYDVVNKQGGTSYFSKLDYKSIHMAGKTGTAQVKAKKNAFDDLNSKEIEWKNRNHAIFAGFAPYKNPEYAVLVFYDHGGGGGKSAAPIAKKIMQDAINKLYNL